MKNIFKPILAAAALLVACGVAETASAQKLGYVNSQELVLALPEVKDVETNMATLEQEITRQLEEMQVERNKMLDAYQKEQATLSESVRQLRETQIAEAGQRIQERYTRAEEEMAAEQQKLMTPLLEKVRTAIQEVMKAQGLAGVLESGVLIAIDDTQMVNVTPLVKTHLGIAAAE